MWGPTIIWRNSLIEEMGSIYQFPALFFFFFQFIMLWMGRSILISAHILVRGQDFSVAILIEWAGSLVVLGNGWDKNSQFQFFLLFQGTGLWESRLVHVSHNLSGSLTLQHSIDLLKCVLGKRLMYFSQWWVHHTHN